MGKPPTGKHFKRKVWANRQQENIPNEKFGQTANGKTFQTKSLGKPPTGKHFKRKVWANRQRENIPNKKFQQTANRKTFHFFVVFVQVSDFIRVISVLKWAYYNINSI